MKSIIKNLFLSNQAVCKPGPTPEEFHFSIGIFNSTEPWFLCEVIESNEFNGDSLVFISNANELADFVEECSCNSIWCFVPRYLSARGEFELIELISIERSVIQTNGDEQPIYKLKFNNGGEVIYDLADTEYPAGVLVFEPYISYPFIQRNKSH